MEYVGVRGDDWNEYILIYDQVPRGWVVVCFRGDMNQVLGGYS